MPERIQKIIAHSGLTSRRKAEKMIVEGLVTVNGRVARLGESADPSRDAIKVSGKRLRPEPLEYYAVYKPLAVLSSVSDPKGRRVVTDLVKSSRRLYPVGRLDFQSEGLLILTNDGALAKRLSEPGGFQKVYSVKVRGVPQVRQLNRLVRGLVSEGEVLVADHARLQRRTKTNSWIEVALSQGKNRQIRRMFEAIKHPVLRLRRISIGPVKLGKMSTGRARSLNAKELERLGVLVEP